VSRHGTRYPPQAILLYVALGIALGLVGWAIWIHDSGPGGDSGTGQAPAQQPQQKKGR
jgi:hypothetical protein